MKKIIPAIFISFLGWTLTTIVSAATPIPQPPPPNQFSPPPAQFYSPGSQSTHIAPTPMEPMSHRTLSPHTLTAEPPIFVKVPSRRDHRLPKTTSKGKKSQKMLSKKIAEKRTLKHKRKHSKATSKGEAVYNKATHENLSQTSSTNAQTKVQDKNKLKEEKSSN